MDKDKPERHPSQTESSYDTLFGWMSPAWERPVAFVLFLAAVGVLVVIALIVILAYQT